MNVPRRTPARQTRADCIEMLSTVIDHAPGSVRGTAVFMLHSERRAGNDADAAWHVDDDVAANVAQRLAAAAPAWHRLLHGERGEFIVIAQGLFDGGAVLGSAARLVHAYDDALREADLPVVCDVSIGIAFSPQHGGRAEALLSAAESGLRDAMRAARGGKRRGDAPYESQCDSSRS
jgi:predicted signal transduction protein with EAL and GGDEF domain